MKTPRNDPLRRGELASRRELFGPFSRFAVAAVHTRFADVSWFVWDAEGDDIGPAVIGQCESHQEALERVEAAQLDVVEELGRATRSSR